MVATTADSADAAQVDRVNVASSFRQAQWLQIVKSAKRSEIARPNFSQVFRASLSICLSISLSTVSTAYFWRIFEKSQLLSECINPHSVPTSNTRISGIIAHPPYDVTSG
jgi:hypothetical protein